MLDLNTLKLASEKLEILLSVLEAIDNATKAIEAITPNFVNLDAVANNIPNVIAVSENEANINAVNANKINIDTIVTIEDILASIYTDKDKLTSIFNDKAKLDSLFNDKVTLDGLFAIRTTLNSLFNDKATIDSLYADKTTLDGLFAIRTTLNSLFIDKIKLDSLYADKATLDSLYADQPTLDALYAIRAKLETLFDNVAVLQSNAMNMAVIQSAGPNATTASQKATEANDARDLAFTYRNQAETFKNQAQSIAGGTIVSSNVQFTDLMSLETWRTNVTNAINAFNTLVASDDTSLDTLQELVTFLKAEKATLDSLGIANIAGLQAALNAKLDATANAVSASKLLTARTINGVSFDGSGDISIEARIATAIASATTTTIGTVGIGESLHITGTTAITNFGASKTGTIRNVTFDGALVLTYNATSLILPTSANITTAAGDTAIFRCTDGTNGYWECIGYLRKTGVPLTLGGLSTTGSAATLTTARTINGVSFNGSSNINIEGRLGTIASAATTTIGTAGLSETQHVTGTTAITSFGVSANGVMRTLIFDGITTLTHNATSLILPDGINITTAVGDSAEFVCENGASGYWRCLRYTRAITPTAGLTLAQVQACALSF